MQATTYELADGRQVGVVAEYNGHDFVAWVLHDADASAPWPVTWTDGINQWFEEWHDVSVALARFAALIRAAESDTFFVHQVDEGDRVNGNGARHFEDLAERFISRVVHSSSCQPGCDGTDPVNHDVR